MFRGRTIESYLLHTNAKGFEKSAKGGKTMRRGQSSGRPVLFKETRLEMARDATQSGSGGKKKKESRRQPEDMQTAVRIYLCEGLSKKWSEKKGSGKKGNQNMSFVHGSPVHGKRLYDPLQKQSTVEERSCEIMLFQRRTH